MLYKVGDNSNDFISKIQTEGFNSYTLSLFNTQYNANKLFKSFADGIGRTPDAIQSLTDLPYLPISFFKTHSIISGNPQLTFESSGTTGTVNSKHFVADESVYTQSILAGFHQYYGNLDDYVILALLPSYLERNNSSLVYMVQQLMSVSNHQENGFYLDDFTKLSSTIKSLEAKKQRVLLLGVTFALLDFAEAFPMHLEHTIVMETGGMKGRREEWTRLQVHDFLKKQFGLSTIHSEYGMTELLSQAYSKGEGLFQPTSTMKVFVRDINDPLDVKETGTGCLNIIDLANIYSCSFIATDDIGTVYRDGSFEVLGRADYSALRGCNLMVV